MSVKFDSLKAGDRLWDCRRSTGLARVAGTRWQEWPVEVIEVRSESRSALVSWNGNPARRVPESYFKHPGIRREPASETERKRAR